MSGSVYWTPAREIFIASWVILGFAMGVFMAVYEELDTRRKMRENRYTDRPPPGIIFLAVWILAPLVAAGLLIFGVFWLSDGGVTKVVDLVEGRNRRREIKREEYDRLLARNLELERELRIGEEAGA